MNLDVPGPKDFPVTVSNMYSNGWKFSVRRGHPDWPGGTISFRFFKTYYTYPGMIGLDIDAYVPLHSAGGACLLEPICRYYYLKNARDVWAKFALKLRTYRAPGWT